MDIGLLDCAKLVALSVTLICSTNSVIFSQMGNQINGKANIIGTILPISLEEFY
jgi:hypothetical protein